MIKSTRSSERKWSRPPVVLQYACKDPAPLLLQMEVRVNHKNIKILERLQLSINNSKYRLYSVNFFSISFSLVILFIFNQLIINFKISTSLFWSFFRCRDDDETFQSNSRIFWFVCNFDENARSLSAILQRNESACKRKSEEVDQTTGTPRCLPSRRQWRSTRHKPLLKTPRQRSRS